MTKKKWCWVATETKKGWRLKLAYGSKDYRVVGALLKEEAIEEITQKGKTVFIHLKGN